MISASKQFIFIHVPKTGGNSLQELLLEYSDDKVALYSENQDGTERFEIKSSYSAKLKKHSILRDYKAYLKPEAYVKYYKFAVVRNPWERAISLYFSPIFKRTEFSEKEFLKSLRSCRPLAYYVNEINLFEKLTAKLGFFKGTNYNLRSQVDLILRFENLEEDLEYLKRELNIELKKLQHRNKSIRKDYKNYYTPKTRDIVYKKFKNEIIEFGYTF